MAFTPGSIAKDYISQGTPTDTSGGFVPGSIAGQSNFGSSRNLGTSQGLYNLANQSGFRSDADRILSNQSGEQTKQIFSGGFISDTFDVLNSLQYGVVGLLKGKSFLEGVKTRQSFTDKDALGDKGIPGVIAGTLLDIAFDPLTYVAPELLVKKVPILAKAVKGVKNILFGEAVTKAIQGTDKTYQALEGGTKLGKYLGSKFSWMFGADPVFKDTFERSVKNIAVETQALTDIGKSVANLNPETAAKILSKDETGRFFRTPLDQLKLSTEEAKPVVTFYKKIDDLGKQAVDLGLLSKDKFEENIGSYIKNAYLEYEQAQKKNLFGLAKTVGIKGIKNRKTDEEIARGYLSTLGKDEIEKKFPGVLSGDGKIQTGIFQRDFPQTFKQIVKEGFGKMATDLGQIDNPAYLLFKSAFDLTKDVENAKLFKSVSDRFATDVAQTGFTKLSTGTRLGELSGKYVPNNMAEYLSEIITPPKDTFTKELVGNFKFFKVVMNPGTHARNIISNKILNYWKLGMNPLDPRVIRTDAIAMKEIAKGAGKWSAEARPLGYNVDTFASAEMKGLLDSTEVSSWGNKLGGLWAKSKKKLGDIYQGEENWAKLSAYIFNRETKGLAPEEAWKAAESATFNYAQVTPFVRKLRESIFGFPFITFTVKATPVAAETIYKNPRRVSVIGKIKQGIENLSNLQQTDRERASEPSWVKDGFYIKLPIKDKQGRSAYFDLTYILPFGDLMAGNFLERQTSRETGLPESFTNSALRKSPFISLIAELGRNQDFYGNKIWRESDPTEKQLGDLMRHLTKTYAPPLVADQLPGGYNEKGVRQQRGIIGSLTPQDKANQQRTLMQELMRNVGAKIQPIDADVQETYQEWNKKKALESLLIEKGVLSSFNRSYVPRHSQSQSPQ